MVDVEEEYGISNVQVSRWRKKLKDENSFRAQICGAAYKKFLMKASESYQFIQQSLSNEHYTPAVYVEAAREVMGGIDLDPASCAEANKVVKAGRFLSAADDGLIRDWHGRVWLNPPYGGIAGRFVAKLVDEMDQGRVMAAIVLVNSNATDTEWFQPLWDGHLCFTRGRINFYGEGERSGATNGSVFLYFGDRPDLFIGRFTQFGTVVVKAAA